MGKKLGHIKQVDGADSIVKNYPVKYCPRATENLFSITSHLSTGSKLQSDNANNIQLMCADGTKVKFNYCIKTIEVVPNKQDIGANMSEQVHAVGKTEKQVP